MTHSEDCVSVAFWKQNGGTTLETMSDHPVEALSLIPNHLRQQVEFVMKDGDSQARNELLVSLKSVFPNAKEGGCGWHILHQGMKTHVPGSTSVTKSNQKKWKYARYKIKQWV